MTPFILRWLHGIKKRYTLRPASVLEIGAYIVNRTPRSVWGDAPEYHGVDLQEGPGVDEVRNLAEAPLGRQYELVVCCETLEHDVDPIRTVAALREHAARWLVITVPANGFPIHRFPRDYWRILPDAFRGFLLPGFRIVELVNVGEGRGRSLCCLAERK